jgi:phage shock protein A
MQARAAAVEELTAAGTLDDFTAQGGDDIDRELRQISQSGQVDDELAKIKAELGGGDDAKELPGGEPAEAEKPAQ